MKQKENIDFELWLEFEQYTPPYEDDPTDDFCNINVTLPDGSRYALNVWTFKFLERARYPHLVEEGDEEPAEYLLPPDLFVEKLTRPILERSIRQIIQNEELKLEWLCDPDDDI